MEDKHLADVVVAFGYAEAARLCDINISVLQMSMGLMVAELLPRVLKRASDRTRKIVLHLSWLDDEYGMDAEAKKRKSLVVESFTTAVSEEESRQIMQMKTMDKIQNAIAPPGSPGAPGMTNPMGGPGVGIGGSGGTGAMGVRR